MKGNGFGESFELVRAGERMINQSNCSRRPKNGPRARVNEPGERLNSALDSSSFLILFRGSFIHPKYALTFQHFELILIF